MKTQIPKVILAERLEMHLGTNVGISGLNTLIYGWTRNNEPLRTAIRHRDWLYDYEVLSLSEYAGCGLLCMG